jgi:hypothetical protein
MNRSPLQPLRRVPPSLASCVAAARDAFALGVCALGAFAAGSVIGAPSPAAANGATADTVVVGSLALRDAKLRLGTETIRSAAIDSAGERPVNVIVQTISREREGGLGVYLIHSVGASARGDTTVGEIVVRADNLALIHHRVKGPHDSMAVACAGDHVTGWVVLPNEPVRLIDAVIAHPVLPVDGPAPWLLTVLPLAEGYSATLRRFDPWTGAEKTMSMRVLGSEKTEWQGRMYECWKIEDAPVGIPGYTTLRWVDRKTRRVLKTILRGKPGQVEYVGIAD